MWWPCERTLEPSITTLMGLALAHGGHDQQPIPADADWTVRHMSEEHHITNFDAGSFFNLHDYDGTNEWTLDDILKTYGLRHESTDHNPMFEKEKAAKKVIDLYDRDLSGTISFAEYTIGAAQGLTLPDFGWGPGHHGDDEYEYEIHHFEKFHGDDATEEELTHPEDIAHFRKHDMLEQQAERQEALDKMSIVEANIPMKFRRNG
ncbi:hypothetical protein LTR22_005093 [Elasticomyces elasticus]|nr:hypothetical protein LTR22_005093 [Elasticomyces elasticus]KAK4927697.1 hypothetical protein LTR49_005567 [Elasticomyces elasticus]KAK5767068.1 hypothetical protein LTS12_002834 [Elasticomyces elasticus]